MSKELYLLRYVDTLIVSPPRVGPSTDPWGTPLVIKVASYEYFVVYLTTILLSNLVFVLKYNASQVTPPIYDVTLLQRLSVKSRYKISTELPWSINSVTFSSTQVNLLCMSAY